MPVRHLTVNYGFLFETLLKRGLCAVISRLLLNLYTHQSMYVKWSEVISKPFTPVNGVKQGGILSPILFTVYIDALFLDFTKQSILVTLSWEHSDMQMISSYWLHPKAP